MMVNARVLVTLVKICIALVLTIEIIKNAFVVYTKRLKDNMYFEYKDTGYLKVT